MQLEMFVKRDLEFDELKKSSSHLLDNLANCLIWKILLTTIGEHLSPLQAFLFPVEFPAQITLSVIVAGLLAFSRHCRFEANFTLICWTT